MDTSVSIYPRVDPEYPDCDGNPMSDNTLQFEWIVKIKGGLEAAFADDPDVFVAGDLLWYALEGSPGVRVAPDVLVVFGRPKGYRGSYKQWLEGHTPPTVVFEILSPGNTPAEMRDKLAFYDTHGVEEYYLFDPEHMRLTAHVRSGATLQAVADPDGWVSPRLGIRFDLSSGDLVIYGPDGRPFATPEELTAQRDEAEQAADQARQAADQARQAADQARQAADQARRQAERLREQLRALGIEPEE